MGIFSSQIGIWGWGRMFIGLSLYIPSIFSLSVVMCFCFLSQTLFLWSLCNYFKLHSDLNKSLCCPIIHAHSIKRWAARMHINLIIAGQNEKKNTPLSFSMLFVQIPWKTKNTFSQVTESIWENPKYWNNSWDYIVLSWINQVYQVIISNNNFWSVGQGTLLFCSIFHALNKPCLIESKIHHS